MPREYTPAPAPAQEVATLSLAAEDVHAAFAKNFPKSRISQAWINFAADIAQAIATRAAKPAQEPSACGLCQGSGVLSPTQKCICQYGGKEPAQEEGRTNRQFDLICQAIDKADTVTMDGDYMLDSDDCIRVVRVMQVLFDISALRAKGDK